VGGCGDQGECAHGAHVQSVEACCVTCGRRQKAEAGGVAEGERAQQVELGEALHATTHSGSTWMYHTDNEIWQQ
jgi:hypothetical protein